MPLQLTPEQEQRIQAIVNAGAYSSAQEALDAAVIAVETAAAPDFVSAREELEDLLMEGLASPEVSDDQFWKAVDRETDVLLDAHKPEPRV